MGSVVQQARFFATQAHKRINHVRKYTKQPYEAHLKAVAELVSSVTDDAELIAAAWLHDTVEDTPATFQDIEESFGLRVAQLVAQVSDVSRPSDGNRARRKALDRAHLAQASAAAKTIKLADIIDNSRDICRNDPRFANVYITESLLLLDVLEGGDPKLYQNARRVLEDCVQRLRIDVSGVSQASYAEDPTAVEKIFSQTRAQRLFAEAFTAKDIAETLRSFDGERMTHDIFGVMQENTLAVVGVREQGMVRGYMIAADDVCREACVNVMRHFADDQVIEGDASLSDVIQILTRHDYCFVSLLGSVVGVITRADVQKPIVRMWLFGMITIIEMSLLKKIHELWPEEQWRCYVPEARLRKAEELRSERSRRGQHCDLLDCLQLSDKAQILIEDPQQVKEYGFATKGEAKRAIKELESLRNHLAHAQDIVTHDWPQIARMTHRVEVAVSGAR